MATRATYKFKDNGWTGKDFTIYIHHDGYPEGAAGYFAAASSIYRAGAEGFIAANSQAYLTPDHDSHGDTEYRYTIEKGQLIAHQRQFNDGVESWHQFYDGTITDFIKTYSSDATLQDRYEIYLACADDGKGIDITTGRKLKTFDEWLNS